MNWIPFSPRGPLPAERRNVLVQCSGALGGFVEKTPSVVVGYLKYAAGDPLSPFFVTPGVARIDVTHWCDCLGDDFDAPLWPGTPGMQRGRPASLYAERQEWAAEDEAALLAEAVAETMRK